MLPNNVSLLTSIRQQFHLYLIYKGSCGALIRAYFSVYYYTRCVLLKAGCEILKTNMCNINFVRYESHREQMNA